jgi:hypothetical protein
MCEGCQLDRLDLCGDIVRRDGELSRSSPGSSSTEKRLCYCSWVRIITRLLVACAAVALLLACLNVDPLGSGLSGDDSNDDVPSSLDISIVLPATQLAPLHLPAISGSVVFDHRPPPSRLTTAEVFRPPRARA